jgi:opacity protein-like surface antigen
VRIKHSWTLVLAAVLLAAVSTASAAQGTKQPNPLLTQGGWEIGGQVSHYQYEEPNFMKLEGERAGFVGAYTFTSPNRVYTRIDLRVSYGLLDYESVGTGTQDDVPDWIGEARAVIGRDYLPGGSYALSPYIGFGYRYLYNDLRGYSSTGAVGYRRISQYYYVPVGVTARFRAGERWVVAPTMEYDWFLSGRQESKLSDTGLGFSDANNKQRHGRGYRAYLMVETGRWAFGPWLHYWKIKDSDIVPIGFGFGAMEPENWTREYGLEFRYRF